MRKICNIVILGIGLTLLLSGCGGKTVELQSESKLVDLNGAIGAALPGGSSLSKNNNELESNDEQKTEEKEESEIETTKESEPEKGQAGAAKEELSQTSKSLLIRINGKDIYYSSGSKDVITITSSDLEKKILSDYNEQDEIILEDDYADATTYNEVYDILFKLKSENNLKFKEGYAQDAQK